MPGSSSCGVTSELGEVQKEVTDVRISCGLMQGFESGKEEKNNPFVSYTTDSFPITELLDLSFVYTATAKNLRL